MRVIDTNTEPRRLKLLRMLADGGRIVEGRVHYRGTVYMGYEQAIDVHRSKVASRRKAAGQEGEIS